MVLHLERRFVSSTETFIADQINTAVNFKHAVFTVEYMKNLTVNAEVFSPGIKLSSLDFKVLNSKCINFFKEKALIVKPDVIHSHFLTDARFFHRFTRNYNVPKICSCYGYDVSKFPKKYGFLAKLYFKKVFEEYDAFLAMSDDMKKDLIKLGCPENKVMVHYYGIDTSFFQVERQEAFSEPFTMLTIGTLVPKKGHLSTLKAIRKIKENHPSLRFIYNIVGDGPLREELTEYVNQNSLNGIVNFKGFMKRNEFISELKSAHVFVHPSVTAKSGDKEGIPGTISEALSSGLPVISTYHAGIPSVIQDGVNGFLVKENDHDAIAEKLLLLINDNNLRMKMAANAKKNAAEKLDIHRKSEQLEKIYSSFISVNVNAT